MNVTDLCNAALGKIGAERITAIDDGTPNANWCQTFYEPLRQAMLRSHHWNFAESRVQLAQDATAPAFEFAYSYTLPADLLKIKEYNGGTPTTALSSDLLYYHTPLGGRYKIEGRKLLTNDGDVLIVYVADVTNVGIWDPLFYQTVATMLASDLARAIARDTRKAESLRQEAMLFFLPLAAAVDGQEGTVLPYAVNDLTWGR